jgi:hypothetical protein
MTTMVSYLPGGTVSFASPGFKVMLSALVQLALRLVALPVTKDEMLVLDLLSNSAFMGTDSRGLSLPTFPGEDCTCHIPGSLSIAL